jgi:hypothetical protein
MESKLIRKRNLGVPMLLTLAVIAALASGQSAANDRSGIAAGSGVGPDRLEGAWNARVEILACATGHVITSFNAMGLFARGGTFHDTNAMDPKLRSAAFGTWRRLGRGSYSLAFKVFTFDAAGTNLGWTIVRHAVVLDDAGNNYVSEGTAEFYDSSGNLFMGGCSRSTATRFE